MGRQFIPVGSWVAIVTPMADDGSLDAAGLSRLVDLQVSAGTSGIVLAGTTGEGAALDADEYARLLDAGLAAVDGRLPVIAGVGSPATRKAVMLARQAQLAGVDGLLCVTPYYLRTTQRGLEAHYHALADAVDLPLILYNVPSRTGVDLAPETTAALSRLEAVVGIKEAVPDSDRIRRLVSDSAPGFAVLSGDDGSCLEAMEAGARGVISVTANVLPGSMQRLAASATAGRWDRARALQARLMPLHRGLMEEPNPIPVKALLHRMGLIQRGIRRPLVEASASLIDRLEAQARQLLEAEEP